MKKSSPIQATIMHVDLDAFFASVEEALNPSLRGRIVIVGGDPRTRGVVACPNYLARQRGIKTAMPLYQAFKIVPKAVFLKGSYRRYQEFSEQFFKILGRYTDKIEPLSLDEAYIDLTGFEKFYISPEQAAHSIRRSIKRELEITASIGIASNKVTAKIASESHKPDAVVYVPRGREAKFLQPLAVRQLPGIGPHTERALRRKNITTIGQIASLPREHMISLFGQHGQILWQMAQGIDRRPVQSPGLIKSVSRSTTFPFDTQDYSFVRSSMFYLLERICKSMRQSNQQGNTLFVKIRYDNFHTKIRQQKIAAVTNQEYNLYRLAAKLLDSVFPQKNKVRLIGIGLANLEQTSRQTSIFELSFYKLKQIQEAVDTIRNRFGFTSIYSGRTIKLSEVYQTKNMQYQLLTPALSR